ncbi:hypothetical protein BH10BDE1_BH10BDE1_24210 [soil metagenome]
MKTSSKRATAGLTAGLTLLGAAAFSGALAILSASEAQAQTTAYVATTPDVNGAISPERLRARRLFEAITAVRTPIDDARVIQMEALLKAGNSRGAVQIATADPLFLDIQIRDLGKMMSTRDESHRAPMSDFVATLIGVVRDSDTTSAKQLLTGNFYYKVDPTIATANTIRSVEMADIIQSNNHYADLTAKNLSPSAVLVKQSPQRILQGGAAIDHPDAAGLITTRDFTEAHMIAGTNRRMVEFSMRQFMCVKMADWADANGSDERVGQDVTRQPGGSTNTYLTTCKSCHSGMDGFRGAFAFFDFTNNAQTIGTNVVNKMTRNATEYPQGYKIFDNSIINNAILPKNADQFGWRSSNTGMGVAAFGKTLADSRGFSRCMVRRAFTTVCRRPPLVSEESLVRSLADQFETDGYHMRRMFENVAVQQQCVQ